MPPSTKSAPFRPPLPSSGSPSRAPAASGRPTSTTPSTGAGNAQRKLEALKRECKDLEAALGGEDADEIVKRHIHLLHLYNERKLATLEQVPAREIQGRLGLDGED
ncbi:hypothetical protein JCM10213_003743 [Rhodosporidiobolus nylandii]